MLVSLSSKFWSRVPAFLHLFKEAFVLFKQNDPLRLASSTAFFTLFSLPPILILLISVFGTLFSDALITGELFERLTKLVGENVASQVELILTNFVDLQGNGMATLSFLFLTFVATTLFSVIQNSVNQLWSIRVKGEKHLKRLLRERLRALVIIFSSGLLFLASLVVETAFAFINDRYTFWSVDFQLHLIHLLNRIIGFGVEAAWFAVILRFLPFGKMPVKAVWVGAVVTAVLFLVGKMVMVRLLVNSDLSSLYATSGSIVVLLLFIFYSAMIFFFGASFTSVYAQAINEPLELKPFATFYETKEIDRCPY